MAKSQKKAHKRVQFNLSGFVASAVAFSILTAGVGYGYREYKAHQAQVEVRSEHEQILALENEYKKASGQVLSGTTIKTTSEPRIRLPIVMYHYIENVKDPGDTIRKSLNIPPLMFEQHLKDLVDGGYTTYFMSDVPGLLSGKVPLAAKSVVLTFDDGYEDFYTDALPLLKKYKVKSTQYVVYDFIGRKGFMSRPQIEELISSGLVEVGSHAVHHISLGSLSETQAKYELRTSKDVLEEMFGVEIKSFAYPYGGHNEKTPEMAKYVRYTNAVSVIPGVTHSLDEMFVLKRIRAGMLGDNAVAALERLTD